MEDNPISSVEEQGMDKGKALVASDTDTDTDKDTDTKAVEIEVMDTAETHTEAGNGDRTRKPPVVEVGDWDENGLRVWRPREEWDKFWFGTLMTASSAFAPYVASSFMMGALNGIMEALTSGHNSTVGVLGAPESIEIVHVLEKVSRRAKRDKLFNMVVKATASHKPNITRIQDEIAEPLGLKFDDDDEKKDVSKRAKRLRERMLMEQKILVILCDISKGLDLNKIGIPHGTDHTGCKLLLTSASEEVLSNQMHAQKIFNV